MAAAALVVVLAACGTGASTTSVTVHHVRVTMAITPPVVALADVLIARTRDGIARSGDAGRTWQDVGLPGRPPGSTIAYTSPAVSDDLALIAGHDVASGSLVWTSSDGQSWSAGTAIAHTTEPAAIGSVKGLLVAAVTTLDRTLEVRVSTDRGHTWRTAPMDAIDVPADGTMRAVAVRPDRAGLAVEVQIADEHNVPLRMVVLHTDDGDRWTRATCSASECSARLGGDALVRQREVSLDDGETWKPFRLVPEPPATQDVPALVAAVDAGNGRYLGTARSDVPSDVSFGYLAAKAPGEDTWRQLVDHDACEDKVQTRPNSSFSLPVRLGQRWFATSTCINLIDPVDAVLVGGRASDSNFEPIAGTRRRHVGFVQPVVVDGRLVVPEVDDRYRVVGLLTLEEAD